jgi:hypothetical protein
VAVRSAGNVSCDLRLGAVTIPIGGFSALSPRGQPSLFDPKPKFEATLSTVESGRSIMREAAH